MTVTPHDDHTSKDELPCYCITWRSDHSYISDNRHWLPTREERRDRAIQYVKDGSLQGYLAYCGGEIVGWCNATADCQDGVNYLRSFWPIEEYRAEINIKSIFCFMIAPDGFDFIEAYVNKNIIDHDYRGPIAMYEKYGFFKSAEKDGRVVVRKALQ